MQANKFMKMFFSLYYLVFTPIIIFKSDYISFVFFYFTPVNVVSNKVFKAYETMKFYANFIRNKFYFSSVFLLFIFLRFFLLRD